MMLLLNTKQSLKKKKYTYCTILKHFEEENKTRN